MIESPLNVALVGFGYAGRTFHAPLITATPTLALRTVVSSQGATATRNLVGVGVVADIDEALSDAAIDLVVVATPNAQHAPLAARALEAGKHVVIDKPFTLTVDEAEALVALAERSGRVLSVFHNRRWDADFRSLQALIETGRLGTIGRLESRFDRYRPERRDRWRERDEPGAGIWFDLGPHLIDQALVLFGMPLAITADIQAQRSGGGAADYAHAVLRYDRLRVILHADMLSPVQPFRFAAHGDLASWVKTGLDTQEDALKTGAAPGAAGWGQDPAPGILTVGATGASDHWLGPDGDYRLYYAGVAEAIAGRGANPVTPEQAVAVMKVLEAGEFSSERRMEIAL